MSRAAWLLFAVLGVVWGVPYLLIRTAVVDLDPLAVAFGRCLIGALVLLPAAVRSGALRRLRGHWGAVAAFALVEIAGPWLLLGHAEQSLTSSTAALVVAVVPFVSVLIAARLGDDQLDPRRVVGLLLGLGGIAVVVGLDVDAGGLPALVALALTVVGYATGPVIISRRLRGVPPLGVVTAALVIAATVYAPFLPFVGLGPVTARAGWSVVVLGVVCTAVAFLAFFALVERAGAARATVITYVNPVVALLLGVVVVDEPFTRGMLLGLPLVLIGSVLGTARPRPAPVPPRRVLPRAALQGAVR